VQVACHAYSIPWNEDTRTYLGQGSVMGNDDHVEAEQLPGVVVIPCTAACHAGPQHVIEHNGFALAQQIIVLVAVHGRVDLANWGEIWVLRA